MYGLQWLVVFLPIITVLVILTTDVLGFSPEEAIAFYQRTLIVSGLTMVAQTLFGHRLPLPDGPAAALVITAAAAADHGQAAISGGMIFGGMLVFLLGASGLTRRIIELFNDRVVGVILLLIGLTIMPYVLPMMLGTGPDHPHGQPLVLGLSLALTIVTALMFHFFKGLLKSLALFWGVILGTLVFTALGLVDYSKIHTAPWLTAPSPWLGPFPRFDAVAALSFALAYLAVMVNAAGSVFSLEPIVRPDKINRRFNRGLALTGLAGILSGAMGVIGTVPYSISPGVITATRVGSRIVLTVCGLLLMALAFFGKPAALLNAVPDAVVAAAILASVGAATGLSIKIINRGPEPMTDRDYMVVGLPILLGVLASQMPESFLEYLPTALRPIAGNGLIVGVVMVLLLEHLLLREKKRKED